MRKCPRCGANVPDENKICYVCGQQMGLFSKVGNSGPIGSNGNLMQSPFEKNKMNPGVKIFLTIFGFFFILPFVVAIIAIIVIFVNVDSEIEYLPSQYESCENYCGVDGVYSVDDGICECGDGTMIDENGNIINEDFSDDQYNNENINNDSNTSTPYRNDEYNVTTNGTVYSDRIISWYEDIVSGKTVVTVVGSSWCGHCINYEPVITKYATDNDIILHFVKTDLLTGINYSYFMDTFDVDFQDSFPYTYVMKNGKFVGGYSGEMSESELSNFLAKFGI